MNRWPKPSNAPPQADSLQRRRNPLPIHGPIRSNLDDFLEALEKAARPRQNPALRQGPWLEEPSTEDVKAALVAKGIVTRGRVRTTACPWPAPSPWCTGAPRQAPAKGKTSSNGTANLAFEAKLCLPSRQAAHKHGRRPNTSTWCSPDPSSNTSQTSIERAFASKLLARPFGDYKGANPEEPRQLQRPENVFWVPAEARWQPAAAMPNRPRSQARDRRHGWRFEREHNPRLKGVLPKDYARAGPDKQRLGELIDVIAKTIELHRRQRRRGACLRKSHRSVDLLAGCTNTSSPALPQPRAERRAQF